MKYSIVLPIYNQKPFITSVIEGYQKAFQDQEWSFELVLVVNGSTDGSLELCQQLSLERPFIKVISMAQKGWGRSVRLGLQEASGEMICYTNFSRTQPEVLVKLLNCSFQNPHCIVKANRKTQQNLYRRLGSLFYNIECRILFDLNCWDINGTPKIFPRNFVKLSELTRNDDLIDLEFLIFSRNIYPVIELPVYSYKRSGGHSTTGYRTALRLYWGAFKLWLDRRKIKLDEEN